MMAVITMLFDTLAYAKKLKEAGAIAEIMDEKLATKKDLKKLKIELKHDIQEMGYKLVIRLGGMIVAGVAMLGLVSKL